MRGLVTEYGDIVNLHILSHKTEMVAVFLEGKSEVDVEYDKNYIVVILGHFETLLNTKQCRHLTLVSNFSLEPVGE